VFGREVRDAGEIWREVALNVSFRSTPPVLALVDAVFANPLAASGVVAPGETLTHLSDRAGHAGRVELWPLAPSVDPDPPEPWSVPADNLRAHGAAQRLAEALAEWIAGQTDGSAPLESRGRKLRPGDVLVLVRRRNAFARALLRALKARGVPLYAITNFAADTFAEVVARFEFFALFDGIVVSGTERLVKPGPAIFQRLGERYGLDLRHCLFVDDVLANVEGARAVGMTAHHFTSAERLRAELVMHGLLPAGAAA